MVPLDKLETKIKSQVRAKLIPKETLSWFVFPLFFIGVWQQAFGILDLLGLCGCYCLLKKDGWDDSIDVADAIFLQFGTNIFKNKHLECCLLLGNYIASITQLQIIVMTMFLLNPAFFLSVIRLVPVKVGHFLVLIL